MAYRSQGGTNIHILEKLWYGNVAPSERTIRTGSRYAKLQKQLVAAEDALREELSPDGKNNYEEVCRKQTEMAQIAECDSFIRGVRIGARLVLDIMEDYPSQLPSVTE